MQTTPLALRSLFAPTVCAFFSLSVATSGQTTAGSAAAEREVLKKEEALVLSPFDVKSTRETGYRATDSKTSTGIALELARIPLNIEVITSQFVDDLSFVSMHETLRYTSGVVIDEFNRDASGVRIRGFQNDNFYRNGIPRRVGVYLDNLERLELVKGPVTAFFAESNPGGIVNYVTKVPEFTKRTNMKLTYGSYDYQNYQLDTQGLVPGYDKLSYRLILTHQDSHDWRDYEYVKRWYGSPELRWRPNKMVDLLVTFERVQSHENLLNSGRTATQYHLDYATPPADVVNFFRNAARPTDAQVISFLQGRWNTNINNWAADLGSARGIQPATVTTGDLSTFYPAGRRYNSGGPGSDKAFRTTQLEADLKLHFTDWADARYNYNWYAGYADQYQPSAVPNGDRTLQWQISRTNVTWTYNDVHSLDIFLKKSAWGINHRLVFGGQIADGHTTTATRRVDLSTAGPVTHGSTVLTGAAVLMFYNPFTDPEIDMRKYIKEVNPGRSRSGFLTKSEYITYQGSALNDRLSTLLGVRRDTNRNSPDGRVPTVGVSYEFLPGFIGFASRSENFRVNGPNITGPGALASEILPNLPPETAKGYDFGVKSNWRDNTLSGTFTYYTLENNNERRTDRLRSDTDPRNRDGTTANDITWFNVGGRERNEGIELDGIWAPNRNYVLTLGYDWVWFAKIVADPSLTPGTQAYKTQIGRRLGNDPRHQFKLWNKYTFTEGSLKGWSFGAGVRYFGPSTAQFTQFIFDWNNPSYQVYDTYIGYSRKIYGRPTTFWLSGMNVTNHIYLQGLNNIYAPPRKFFLNVKFDL